VSGVNKVQGCICWVNNNCAIWTRCSHVFAFVYSPLCALCWLCDDECVQSLTRIIWMDEKKVADLSRRKQIRKVGSVWKRHFISVLSSSYLYHFLVYKGEPSGQFSCGSFTRCTVVTVKGFWTIDCLSKNCNELRFFFLTRLFSSLNWVFTLLLKEWRKFASL